MKDMTGLDPAVQLLTILNVQSAKKNKRKLDSSTTSSSSLQLPSATRDWHAIAKRARSQAVDQATLTLTTSKQTTKATSSSDATQPKDIVEVESAEAEEQPDREDEEDGSFERHWNRDSTSLPQQIDWKREKLNVPHLGNLIESFLPEDATATSKSRRASAASASTSASQSASLTSEMRSTTSDRLQSDSLAQLYHPKLLNNYSSSRTSSPQGLASASPFEQKWLSLVACYKDVLYPTTSPERHHQLRSTTALHAMNHVLKTRNKVLKTNEYLSKTAASKTPSAEVKTRNIQDQGFTRPKILVLTPFRNSALTWVDLLCQHSLAETVENRERFETEYDLPQGASDKLAENPQDYPADHVSTFKGNIDDNFRLGMKVTRKTIKLFSEFYSCDVIVASPLGLRTSIEKEKGDFDFLSSIEVLVIDQMDVMLMQNWDHVNFIMERMNKLPEEAHGCDFSRVKPWYLDGKASHYRQSILLSAFETPEIRSLYNRTLVNVEGKLKVDVRYDGLLSDVPKGIRQIFTRFETNDLYSEDDARFEHFTTKTLPMLRRSAVSSSQTIIFVPSYFDFLRIKKYMKSLDGLSFSSISEYTPTPDISRARGAFFAGKTSFMLVTERFHFFRRYRIRDAKTFVFYGPPDHANFYPEILSFPFARPGSDLTEDGGIESAGVDASELSCQVIFSKFDLLRLERLCGTSDAKKMVKAGIESSRFTFLI